MLGLLVPRLVNGGQLQAQVDATAQSYVQELSQRYPDGVPAGTVLGDPGQPAQPGLARPAQDGTLAIPAITGPIPGGQAVTAVVAVAADGTVVASSAPSLYRPGRAAASELPAPVTSAIAAGPGRMISKVPPASTPYGTVLWDLAWPAGPGRHAASRDRPPAFMSRRHGRRRPGSSTRSRAWSELVQLGETRPLLSGPVCAAPRDRAGRRAVRAAGLAPSGPPGPPPGTSYPRGRGRRLHRHPARLRPGRGRPAGGELHHHDPPARLRRWPPNGSAPPATRAPPNGPGSRGRSTTRSPSTCSACG